LVTPNSFEYERRIFALFLIDEYFEGDDTYEGYVASTGKYRLHFTRRETNDLRFWDFYENTNSTDKRWGSGLFRYLSDEQCARILYKAMLLKQGTEDETLAEEMYRHYCMSKGVKIEEA